MANVSKVNGFTPIRTKSGASVWPLHRYHIDSSNSVAAVGVGTMMALVANTSDNVYPEVVICAAGSVPVGPVVSLVYDPDSPNRLYLPSSTSGDVLIADSPDLIMEVEMYVALEDGDFGSVANLYDAGTSTTSGMSGQSLNTPGTTASTGFIIHRLINRPDNALGAYARVECSYNYHAFTSVGTASNFTGVHN